MVESRNEALKKYLDLVAEEVYQPNNLTTNNQQLRRPKWTIL